MNRRTFTQLASGAILSPNLWSQSVAARPGNLTGTLSADPSGRAVSPNRAIFGQFLEHFHRAVYGGIFDPGSPLSGRRGFRQDVIAALRELKVPIVRWPGGCFASAYHWQEGVGPDRQPSYDKAWCVEESNRFGTDEFVAWCRAIGAEPYICTNAGTGTPEEMSNWVEYCNLPSQGRYARSRRQNGNPEPYNVKYWSIGNENYFGSELGAKTPEEWALLVRESAKLMRAVDPRVKLLAAATTQGDWTSLMLKHAGEFLSYISIHGYWDPLWQVNKPSSYMDCVLRSDGPEKQITEALAILDQSGYRKKIAIAFDEWNLRSWHHPPGYPGGGPIAENLAARDKNDLNETYTMADAVFSASFLNTCLRHAEDVKMACMAPVVNVRGPLFVHPKGLVKRTTFHVLQMYATLLEDQVLPATVTTENLQVGDKSVAALDGLVTRSPDGRRFATALVNRDPERSARWTLNVGKEPWAAVELTMLTAESKDAFNDVANPDRVVPTRQNLPNPSKEIVIPPHSVAIARFTA